MKLMKTPFYDQEMRLLSHSIQNAFCLTEYYQTVIKIEKFM